MKKTIALIFGGRSAEHEISFLSAKSIFEALDKSKYDPVLIAISKEGSWYRFKNSQQLASAKLLSDKNIPADCEPAALISLKGAPTLIHLNNDEKIKLDAAFPILHGTFGEDGCIQGLFKMAQIPFVGCGVLSSSVGMDKEVMKRLFIEAKIPAAKHVTLRSHEKQDFQSIEKALGLPFFIKPANAGSSVGVHKIKSAADFTEKIQDAFKYDHKVLAEEFIEGREIECSVMGLNHSPKASVPGEVTPTHEFYSYEAKYLDENGAALKIPAQVSPSEAKQVQDLAKKVYQVMGCDGLTRVDFFLKKNGQAYVNEINTIPGFTKISMYPKMWEASGISYQQLITDLIELAFSKFKEDNALTFSF